MTQYKPKHRLLLDSYNKICPICQNIFYNKKINVKYCCNDCKKKAHINQKREYFKEYYLKHKKEILKQHKEYFKKYYLKNREKKKEYNHLYYLKNKEKHNNYSKEYYRKNKKSILKFQIS